MPRKEEQRQVAHTVETGRSSLAETMSAAIEAGAVDEAFVSAQQSRHEQAAQPISVNTAATHEQSYAGLLPLLQRLDERLSAAVKAADRMFAARAAGDLYRGLAISPADVAAALGRVPAEPFLYLGMQAHELAEATDSLSLHRLLWLQSVYGLTAFDLDVILLGLAQEIDLRYERLYAYLQDDVTRRRPGIDLALNILCSSAAEKLQQRERFAPDAPLICCRLIEIFADPHGVNSPLLARYFRLDEQIVRFLLLDDSMDSRLAEFCQMVESDIPQRSGEPLTVEMQQQLHGFAETRPQSGMRLYFQGPAQCGQTEAVALLASILDQQTLKADLRTIGIANTTNVLNIMHALVREAWFRDALLHLQGVDTPGESFSANRLDPLWQALKIMPADCVIESEAAWIPAPHKPVGVVTVPFSYPATEQRQEWWQQCLAQNQLVLDDDTIAELAQRYRMTYARIQDAAASGAVAARAAQKGREDSAETAANNAIRIFFAAARGQCGHDLATLTCKIEPRATWDDLVLPADETAQLHEICQRFKNRDQVFYRWGFDHKLSYGRGTTALFSGGSGTGKTMAAEVIANALELDLYRIDLAQVVSKYIGETERNLNNVFTAAANANAILFFDEADALFGKRSEVKDSHDRYANLEISYLLQKMEQYEGIAILATNLSDNLDKAFTRRLAFSIHFSFPDEAQRLRLWQYAWPAATPVSDDVNLGHLAKELKLSGGSIKNIGIGSAFLAAADGGVVTMQHLLHAAEREHEKMGKTMTANLVTVSRGERHGRT
jgi:AAA+ superfamily predicted ATPase